MRSQDTYSDNYQLSHGHLDATFRLWKGKQGGCLRYAEQETNNWLIPGAELPFIFTVASDMTLKTWV